jgi:hypothetical protein
MKKTQCLKNFSGNFFSGFDYKKIFDSLETEIQEMLIIELNKKYKFLEGKMHRSKIH